MNTVKLKELMKARGVSVHDLAQGAVVSDVMIYKILNGTRDPSLSVAKVIAEYLGTTVDDLL